MLNVGFVDFDTTAHWEPGPMVDAKARLTALHIAYEQRGRGWLRIPLTEHSALFLAPNTGSIRFSGGRIFSSKGLLLALEIVKVYR
jgi:hypothetical protein